MFHQFLDTSDADRALELFQKLKKHDTSQLVLTGGIALEIHRLRSELSPSHRTLNDLDFIAESFDCIPQSLADEDFLFRHIHPFDPSGKIILQFVACDLRLRVDVFRGHRGVMDRSSRVFLPTGAFRLASLEDIMSRTARVLLELERGRAVASKHAADFLCFGSLVNPVVVEEAWHDHKTSTTTTSYAETCCRLADLIQSRPELLISPHYSQDTETACPRCASTKAFRLADPALVLPILGYC
jgi:hypothetical protein